MRLKGFKAAVAVFGKRGGIKLYFDRFIAMLASNNSYKRIRRLPYSGKPLYYRSNSSDLPLIVSIFIAEKEYDLSFKLQPTLIFDLGANIGLFTRLYAAKYPEASIIAVEPESNNFEILLQNTVAYDTITTIHGGVWYRDAELKIIDRGTGEWGFTCEEVSNGEGDVKGIGIDEIVVKNVMSDRMKNVKDKRQVVLVKMDIEGCEKQIFDHISSCRWLSFVDYLIIELHDRIYPGSEKHILDFMRSNGYRSIQSGENFVFYRDGTLLS